MDYTSVAGRLSFSPGQFTNQIVVPILDNSGYSGNRSFRTQLKNAQGGAVLGTPATAEVTIVDNESSLRLTSTSYEIPEGGPTALVTVTRIGWLSNSVSVSYATQDGTAISGADYVAVSGTLVFGIGESNRSLLVPIIDDTEIEPHENFLLALFNPSGGAVLGGPSSANVLIRENDAVLTCDEIGLRTALANGGTVRFACGGVISLSNPIKITNDTVLDANLNAVTLSGNGRTRVFEVSPGTTLTLNGLRIASGWAATSVGSWMFTSMGVGGGIANTGTVHAVNCTFEGNSVVGFTGPSSPWTGGSGGAVYNVGNFFATNCVFRANSAFGGSGAQQSIALPGATGAGGAIYSTGPSVLVGCTFLNNVAQGGAGAHGTTGPFLSPTGAAGGQAQGGAIYNGGPIHIARCLFGGNQAIGGNGGSAVGADGSGNGGNGGTGGSGQGGAAFIASGEFVVSASTFSRNSVFGGASTAASDGRVALPGYPGAGGYGGSGGDALGGAIFVAGGFVAMTNNTIAENNCSARDGSRGGNGTSCAREVATPSGAPGGNGGAGGNARGVGLFMTGGQGECVNNTIANNRGTNGTPGTGGNGGTACFPYPSGTNGVAGASGRVTGENLSVTNGLLTLRNTLIAYSVAGQNCEGTVVDGGHNLSSDDSCGFAAAGSVNNVDPRLGPLANNGGPTPTMALAPDSPALDAGDNAACPPLDQRGMPRPTGAACDIGAFEGSNGLHHPRLKLAFSPAGVALDFVGFPNTTYVLQAGTNLIDWVSLTTNRTAANGLMTFTDTPTERWKFYRARLP